MDTRPVLFGIALAMLLCGGAGCHRWKAERESILAEAPSNPDTTLRIRWAGKSRLGVDATAYYVTRLWHLPQSRRLEAQTLNKLSAAPWLLTGGPAALQNAPAFLMRPLLDDLVKQEFFLEVRRSTNALEETVFAIRLDDTRAGLWRTNLVGVIASITGIQTMDILDNGEGWALKQSPQRQFRLTRKEDWTVLGIGGENNSLLQETLSRIRFPAENEPASTNRNWLELEIDTSRFGSAVVSNLIESSNLPRMALTLSGDGGHVLTRVLLRFPESLAFPVPEWSVPTNLMRGRMTSFAAARGVGPLLSKMGWGRLNIGAPPAQVYSWGESGSPFRTFVAAPIDSARQSIEALSSRLITEGNPWLSTRGYVGFERLSGAPGVVWGNLPELKPFISLSETGDFAYAGLLPGSNSAATLPESWVAVAGDPNVIAYDWEDSAARAEAGLSIAQVLRLVLRRAQLPPDSAAAEWLIAMVPRLDVSETILRRDAPNALSFERKSTTGFTGAELNLIADWLESPRFPLGLHSDAAAPAPRASSEN